MKNRKPCPGAEARALRFRVLPILAIALTLGMLAAAPAAAAESNKWRIEVSEAATSAGEIAFGFAPRGGESFEVTVQVDQGLSKKAVARRIAAVLELSLDTTAYKVKVDKGEDVLIERTDGRPDFGLTVTRNSTAAVIINLDRE